jgi:hypothetical protein
MKRGEGSRTKATRPDYSHTAWLLFAAPTRLGSRNGRLAGAECARSERAHPTRAPNGIRYVACSDPGDFCGRITMHLGRKCSASLVQYVNPIEDQGS